MIFQGLLGFLTCFVCVFSMKLGFWSAKLDVFEHVERLIPFFKSSRICAGLGSGKWQMGVYWVYFPQAQVLTAIMVLVLKVKWFFVVPKDGAKGVKLSFVRWTFHFLKEFYMVFSWKKNLGSMCGTDVDHGVFNMKSRFWRANQKYVQNCWVTYRSHVSSYFIERDKGHSGMEIAPDNSHVTSKKKIVSQPSFFRGHLGFQGCKIFSAFPVVKKNTFFLWDSVFSKFWDAMNILDRFVIWK